MLVEPSSQPAYPLVDRTKYNNFSFSTFIYYNAMFDLCVEVLYNFQHFVVSHMQKHMVQRGKIQPIFSFCCRPCIEAQSTKVVNTTEFFLRLFPKKNTDPE